MKQRGVVSFKRDMAERLVFSASFLICIISRPRFKQGRDERRANIFQYRKIEATLNST